MNTKKKARVVETVAIEGTKHDTGKPNYSLISPIATALLASVLDFGATKYAAHNWRRGILMSKFIAASERHLAAINAGIDFDAETGLPHAAHLMCEAMFMCEQLYREDLAHLDDRFKYSEENQSFLEQLLSADSLAERE